MANNQFDRTAINVRERPLADDINSAQSQLDRTLRYVIDQLFVPRASDTDERKASAPLSGFIGDGFRVRESSPVGLSVALASGLGFQSVPTDVPNAIGGVPGIDDLSRYKPLPLLADVTINVPAADPTNARIDIVEVAFNRRLTDSTTRDVLNASTGAFDPTSVNKTLAFSMSSADIGTVTTPANNTTAIGYKAGLPSGTPSIPPTTPGYVKIAEILVGNGVTQVNQEDITDLRLLLGLFNRLEASIRFTSPTTAVPCTIDSVQAPHGVRLVTVHEQASGFDEVWVLAGAVPDNIKPPTFFSVVNVSTGGVADPITSVTLTTVDAALQTRLASSVANPQTDVAIGQRAIQVNFNHGSPQAVQYIYRAMVAWGY